MTIQILVLTRENCGYCDTAKAILERLSTKHPLSVSAISLDSPDGQALAERNGILFPPGILIDGEAFGHGRLSERKLRLEIERRLSRTPPASGLRLSQFQVKSDV